MSISLPIAVPIQMKYITNLNRCDLPTYIPKIIAETIPKARNTDPICPVTS